MEVMGHVRGAGGRGGDMERSLEGGQLMEEEEVPHHHMRWRQMNEGVGGVGGERNGGEWGGKCKFGGKIKLKGEEGEGQKIKYRSVHWNNAGQIMAPINVFFQIQQIS